MRKYKIGLIFLLLATALVAIGFIAVACSDTVVSNEIEV